jgi:TIR domain
MGFRVFISYSTRDLTRTTQIKRLLEGAGAQVFVAEYSLPAGTELAREIIAAIKACDLFVLLWSHHARKSEWVPQEIGVAKGHDKPVIPIVLHAGAEVPGFLRGLKYLPLYSDPRKALTWLQRHVTTKVAERSQAEGFAWLGITGVLLWLASQDKRKR